MIKKRNPLLTAAIVALPFVLLLVVATLLLNRPEFMIALPLGLSAYAAVWFVYRTRKAIEAINAVGEAMDNAGFVE